MSLQINKKIVNFGLMASGCFFLAACGGGSDSGGVNDSASSTFTITAGAGTGGAISPSSRNVQNGQVATFTVTYDEGYSIASVTGCNGSLSANTYTTGAITSTCSVQASFTVNSYTVSATTGSGGSISPGSAIVAHGGTTSFILTPQTGFSIASVSGCNGSLNGNTYTTSAITSSCSVQASFNQNSYMVTAIATEGGQITPGSLNVLHEQTAQFSAIPDDNYRIVEVTGCGGSLAGETYTTAAITASCSINAKFAFAPIGGLNDTGIDWCANGDTANSLDCPVTGFEGQDGEFGRDASARTGALTKIGGGAAGFDYTKIATDGSVLEIQNAAWEANGTEAAGNQWSCVRDNVTGLIWEVKTTDGGMRDFKKGYTWYNPDSNTNGGYAGLPSISSSAPDTNAFVQAVNSQGLCGANDWRMPTHRELLSIVHNGRFLPSIDIAYFPHVTAGTFWSSSPNAMVSTSAFYVAFDYGRTGAIGKNVAFGVRLVRSGQ
ncbi:Lcl C-terminal domain-containing protein [Alishewanella sp. HL-SH05]|uniref:Lcl C-terminal domain-containing protein n=1 Tax=Alishewanella sp. HL-SH05 TaxID=3461145 RepID=UPI004042E85F